MNQPVRILYVDDYPLDRELVRDALEKEHGGFDLVEAASRAEFEMALAQGGFDLVLSDFNILGFEGLQVLETVRATGSNLPVIIVTGTGSEEVAAEAIKGGAADYVIKSTKHIQRLPHTIHAVLDKKRLEDERKQADEALHYQARLLENVSDAIISSDLAFKVVTWNHAAETLYGWQAQEVIGLPVNEVIPTEFLDTRGEDSIEQLMTQGLWEGEVTQPRRDGTKLHLLSSVSLIRDQAGNPSGAVAVNRDITDRKRAEAQLYLQSAALNAAANAIVITDKAGDIEWVNPAFVTLTGYTASEATGKTLQKLVRSGAHDEGFYKNLLDTTQAGEVWRGEIINRCKDGSSMTEEQTITPLLDEDGEISHFITIQQDITPRKQAEESVQRQLRRLAALHAIDVIISGSLDLRLALNTVLSEAITQLNVDAASILLLNPHLQVLEYAAGIGFRSDALQHTRLRVGEGFAGQAVLERRLINIPDLRNRKTGFLRSPYFLAEGFVAYYVVPLSAKGEVKGVLEIFHRSPLTPEREWLDFFETLAGQAAIAIDNAQLFEGLQRANLELALAYNATIEGWSRALDLRDKETEGHTQRVTEMTLRLAQAFGVNEEKMIHIHRGSLLHDIGKMGVPDYILLKPGSLTDEEWVIMKKHPVYAYEMLSPIAYLKPALDIPYCHHEKWDGTGYPRGLEGEQIPFAASIFSVVDVWDALTSDRPYRPAWSQEQALEYIKQQSGKYFNPKVVKIFIRLILSK